MKASIIIPAHNHAEYLPDAIASALAQSIPSEVIVIDDGSTDATFSVLAHYSGKIKAQFQAHGGVAKARNAGVRLANGEFLMFLDADDVIAPNKVERQLAEFRAHPECDWALCDVRIVDEVSRKDELASTRYGYAEMNLVGRIGNLLAERNFIPVHAPLIRRSALGSVRFPEGPLEDWAFWKDLADVASVRYIPEVLATYRKKRTGRNQTK